MFIPKNIVGPKEPGLYFFRSSSLMSSVAKGVPLTFQFLEVIKPKHSIVLILASSNSFLCTSDHKIRDIIEKFVGKLIEVEGTCVKFILLKNCESRPVGLLEVP
ncbi:unnamed protein product [Rodentolepis nana]|uniref:DUF721 domain-containing protein n=1 Tax=Rodentolepis nana TaxID=102285 RepID=A0A0R3THL1_RODNA|nr:unnamed protein product [Rodentolepis nana]